MVGAAVDLGGRVVQDTDETLHRSMNINASPLARIIFAASTFKKPRRDRFRFQLLTQPAWRRVVIVMMRSHPTDGIWPTCSKNTRC